MVEVNANIVKELRDKTGAGMMQCKKALQETKGDVETAVEYLRKMGQFAAGKRADRVAKEGKVAIQVGANHAVMVELNAETDFVAKNDDFNALLGNLVKIALEIKPQNAETLLSMASPVLSGRTVKEALTEKIAVIGENITLRRACTLEQTPGTKIFSYIHMGGKIGVLLRLKAEPAAAFQNEAVLELGKDVCLHVCASAPLAIDSTGIPAEKIAKEREIERDKAIQEGKPEKIIDKIVQGKVDKYFKDNCLVNQLYVKDPEQKETVAAHIDATAKAAGANVTVEAFVRYQLGSE